MNKETIDLLEYLPIHIVTGSGKQRPLDVHHDNESIVLRYQTWMLWPNGKPRSQEFSYSIPRYVVKNERTYEVLGLLQAEMGKTQNGNLSFSNHEYHIINRVIKWFEEELGLERTKWKWSIKVNINEPSDPDYKQVVEQKVINHWTTRTSLTKEQAYPKRVTYVNENYTKNKKLRFYNYGTLVLEHKNNLFSQIMKNFVKKVTYERIVDEKEECIRGYMRGIIAGEGTIDLWKPDKRYRVYISVTKEDEKQVYHNCLLKLGINSIKYPGDKLIVSKRKNNAQLLLQKLITLSHEKYAKFLTMMQQYPDITEETGYFIGKRQHVWNKHPQARINKIIELYRGGVTRTKDIADIVGVSAIKVNRVLKENKLGKRKVPNYSQEIKQKIVQYAKNNPLLGNDQIASIFNVSKSAVQRMRTRYHCRRPRDVMKTPQEKIDRIIQIYHENPIVKLKDIAKEVGVSDTVVENVRKRYGLMHLGYMHLIGNNNRKYKEKQRLNVTTQR